MKNKWGNYAIGSGKVKSCYQREYINRKKCRQASEASGSDRIERSGEVQKKEVNVEKIHRDDCGRLDDLAITQPVNSVEIIQPVQAVPRCKTKSGRQASNLATISKRPKNKPKIQKGVKKSTDGCNTGLD